jgi:hypothetical protein
MAGRLMGYHTLTHAPCPHCGGQVTHFSSTTEDVYYSPANSLRAASPEEWQLWPCGHHVSSYTVDTINYTVAWNTQQALK